MCRYATRRTMRRGLGLFALLCILGTVGLGVWHPARVAVQTLLLLPALFPSAPLDPLSLVTATPSEHDSTYSYAAGTVDAQLFQPAGGGRHGAMILMLGAGDLPRGALAVHFAEALARLGVVALIPESSGLLAERMTFDEVDAVRTSLNLLASEPDVNPDRVGLVGLSASGGLSIVAAAQPDLRDRVRFVNSFGSYDDATTLLVDVASQSIDVDGQVRPWPVEERTRQVVWLAIADLASDPAVRDQLSLLMQGLPRERAQAIVDQLPGPIRERLQSISPSTYLSQIRAHLYLMHDVDDPFIPFTQSRDLAADAPAGVVQRYTEFSIFAHVIPEKPVPWQTLLPDLWRLFWHVHAVLLEVL
jgi:dienelactone hydrolase